MSNKSEFYIQCRLEKGNTHTTAWIEERFAVVNKLVKMEKPDGSWEEGWIVTGVGDTKRSAKATKEAAHNFDDIWKATSGPCPRGNK